MDQDLYVTIIYENKWLISFLCFIKSRFLVKHRAKILIYLEIDNCYKS